MDVNDFGIVERKGISSEILILVDNRGNQGE